MTEEYSKTIINQMFDEWESFIVAANKNPTFRPAIMEEWQRCKELGVSPHHINYVFLTEEELKQKQKDNSKLIEVAKPYMEHLSLMLKGKPHMIVLADKDGWIIWVEGTPYEIGGGKIGLDIGANWSEQYIGNNGIGTALSQKKPVLIYGVEHYCEPCKACACLGIPIKIQNDKIVGALVISVPVEYAHPGCLNIAQACVNSIESHLNFIRPNAKNDQVDKLLATASLLSTTVHDIKNPLTTIRGLGQLGSMVSESDKERKYFQKIVDNVDSLTDMLNGLLGIFKEESFTPCSLVIVSQEIIEELRPVCNVQNINLEFSADDNVQIQLQVALFKRAIYNLLKNSIKAMPDGGKISLNIFKEKGKVLISIEDNGPGVPPEIQDKIFEPFVHGRQSGTGLGLYMVNYAITTVHKGRIWFNTKPGKGTTFYIEIPFVQELDPTVDK
ncbi:MAG: GAF domain-containing protein [Firmicutes bacterium]|nr:GAF domain-containing protein [Bacillota bacterium]